MLIGIGSLPVLLRAEWSALPELVWVVPLLFCLLLLAVTATDQLLSLMRERQRLRFRLKSAAEAT